jgi:hypothetical protein
MTAGVMQAVQLRDTTAGRLRKAAGSGTAAAKRAALQGLSTEFHAKLPAVLDFPWTVATGDAPRCRSRGTVCTSQPAGTSRPCSYIQERISVKSHSGSEKFAAGSD